MIDPEQTDNFQSPWDTVASSMHTNWRSAYPSLAHLVKPRTRRGVIRPSSLVEAPESMELDFSEAVKPADVNQPDLIERVLKRLLSNEASQLFYSPVPKSEKDYYKTIDRPLCLAQIVETAGAGGYASYSAFHGVPAVERSRNLCLCAIP